MRVCQVEMIHDANWKTIYNLFKLISCGYLLLDCSKNTRVKGSVALFPFFFFFLFFSSFPLPLNNTLAHRHAWSSREKEIWHDRCCAEALVAAQLSIIIPHYISSKFGNILQTTNISFFVKPDICTPNVHASLWQPCRGSRWKTGIDLRAAEKWNVQGAGRADVLNYHWSSI